LPLVYTQRWLIFAVHPHFPSRSKPFVQNQERSRIRLNRRIATIRLIDDLCDTVPRMWQHLGATQEVLSRVEVVKGYVSFGKVIKTFTDSIYEFTFVVGGTCNPMHQSDSPHRLGIFVQPVAVSFQYLPCGPVSRRIIQTASNVACPHHLAEMRNIC